MKSAIVVGGGFCGCTIAHRLSKAGWKVKLFEKDSALGGGCRTFWYGGHPFTYGPRHLWTPDKEVFDYLNEIVPLRRLNHHLFSYNEPDQAFYSYPIHMDDVKSMPDYGKIKKELDTRKPASESKNFEEYWINSVGRTLYDKFINNYSKKMWQIEDNKLLSEYKFSPKGVPLQTGTRQVCPDYYISYPINPAGWNPYFDKCVENVEMHLNTPITSFDLDNCSVFVGKKKISADILISTLSPDLLFNYKYGRLRYVGRQFLKVVLPIEKIFPDDIYFIHYPGPEPFTRIVEYKKLTGHKSKDTFLGIEIPTLVENPNHTCYPFPIKKEMDHAQKYLDEIPPNVYSIGRFGTYRYKDVHDIIHETGELAEQLGK